MFKQIAKEKRWSTDEQIDVLLDYIGNQDSEQAFEHFLLDAQPGLGQTKSDKTVTLVESYLITSVTQHIAQKDAVPVVNTYAFKRIDTAARFMYAAHVNMAAEHNVLREALEMVDGDAAALRLDDDVMLDALLAKIPLCANALLQEIGEQLSAKSILFSLHLTVLNDTHYTEKTISPKALPETPFNSVM